MDAILRGYEVNAATWFYLSLLLITAVFFRFNRFWSLRNLDLALLLALSPGLIFVRERLALGYVWLFIGTGLLLLRLFCDSLFTRRPRLEQNLNTSGLAFLGICTFAFLMTKVLTEPLPNSTVETIRRGHQLASLQDAAHTTEAVQAGPASGVFALPFSKLSDMVASSNGNTSANDAVNAAPVSVVFPAESAAGGLAERGPSAHGPSEQWAARLMALFAHLAVVFGLILVGRLHFGDLQIGLAMATLYLLLPCTAFDVHKVIHVLPAALIVWAFVAYRKPMVAGGLMGLACGTLFFPIFLLPLWAAFYDRRGALRFGGALGIVGAALLGSVVLTSADPHSFTRQTLGLIDWSALQFRSGDAGGFWSLYDSAYRMPVFVAFLVMSVVLTVWPKRKTLEHLMAHSAAIVVGTQFWYPQQGGEYMLWYLPLVLLVVFRPTLSHLRPPEFVGKEATVRLAPEHAPAQRSAAGTLSSHLFR
jgi:hypothetical protein